MRSMTLCYARKEPSLLSLAKNKRYDDIYEKLESKGDGELSSWLGVVPNNFAGAVDDDNTAVCSLALHQIMVYNPPDLIVRLLIKKMKQIKSGYIPEAAVDELSQTALHVAVEVGCDIRVIKALTENSDLPAFTMDSKGRFPLHIACYLTPRRGRCLLHNTELIINHLLEVYPQAAIVPDLSGRTPLELFVSKGVGIKERRIVLTLRMVQQILSKESTPSVAKTATSTTDETPDIHHLVSNYILVNNTYTKDLDDISSVGSRGVSRTRTQPNPPPPLEVEFVEV